MLRIESTAQDVSVYRNIDVRDHVELLGGNISVLSGSYGIFSGVPRHRARLQFTAERARWVAAERWHEHQSGTWLEDGSFVLEVPYADDRELVMDILKHGAAVKVLGPPELQERVRAELGSALAAQG